MSFSVSIALTAALFGAVDSAAAEARAASRRSPEAAVVYIPHIQPREVRCGYISADVSTLLNLNSTWITCSHATVEADQAQQAEQPAHAVSHQPSAGTVVSHRLPEYEVDETAKPDDTVTSDEASPVDVSNVDDLFSPMRELKADGASSAPPELPEDSTMQSLARPQTLASPYLKSTVPGYYATTGYGVRRAPRNTHCFYSHPLYYEEVNLERCGRSKGCCTTACSAIHFATRAAITPYLMTLQHHDECVATLPDCPTCHKFGCDATCPEWSLKAALVQGAAVTGVIYAIP